MHIGGARVYVPAINWNRVHKMDHCRQWLHVHKVDPYRLTGLAYMYIRQTHVDNGSAYVYIKKTQIYRLRTFLLIKNTPIQPP